MNSMDISTDQDVEMDSYQQGTARNDELHDRLSTILKRFEETREAIRDNVKMLESISDSTTALDTELASDIPNSSKNYKPAYRRSQSIPSILENSNSSFGLRTMSSVDSGVMLTLTSGSELGTQSRWRSIESWKDDYRSTVFQEEENSVECRSVSRGQQKWSPFRYTSTSSENGEDRELVISAEVHITPINLHDTTREDDCSFYDFKPLRTVKSDSDLYMTYSKTWPDLTQKQPVEMRRLSPVSSVLSSYDKERFEEQVVEMAFDELVTPDKTPVRPVRPPKQLIRRDVQEWVDSNGSTIDYIIKSSHDNLTCVVLSPAQNKITPYSKQELSTPDKIKGLDVSPRSRSEPHTKGDMETDDQVHEQTPEPSVIPKQARPNKLDVQSVIHTAQSGCDNHPTETSLDYDNKAPPLSRVQSSLDCRQVFSPIPEESIAENLPPISKRHLPAFKRVNKSTTGQIKNPSSLSTAPNSDNTYSQEDMHILASSTTSTNGSSLLSKSTSTCSYCKAIQNHSIAMPQDKLDHRVPIKQTSDTSSISNDSSCHWAVENPYMSTSSDSSYDDQIIKHVNKTKLTPLQAYRYKNRINGTESMKKVPPVIRRLSKSNLLDVDLTQHAPHHNVQITGKFMKKQSAARQRIVSSSHEPSNSLLRYFRFPSPPINHRMDQSEHITDNGLVHHSEGTMNPVYCTSTSSDEKSSAHRNTTEHINPSREDNLNRQPSETSLSSMNQLRNRPRMGTLTLSYQSIGSNTQLNKNPSIQQPELHLTPPPEFRPVQSDYLSPPIRSVCSSQIGSQCSSNVFPPGLVLHPAPSVITRSKKKSWCPIFPWLFGDGSEKIKPAPEHERKQVAQEDQKLMLDLKHGEVKVHRTFNQSKSPHHITSNQSDLTRISHSQSHHSRPTFNQYEAPRVRRLPKPAYSPERPIYYRDFPQRIPPDFRYAQPDYSPHYPVYIHRTPRRRPVSQLQPVYKRVYYPGQSVKRIPAQRQARLLERRAMKGLQIL